MKNISVKDLIKIFAILYFAVIAFLFLSIANKYIENQNLDIKMKKELHIANLIGQYNNDLNACLESSKNNKQLTEETCIKTMNESNLAKLIISWGYQDALMTIEKLKINNKK